MGKDYNDDNDKSRKIHAVMDGAPAYQPDSYLYVVPDSVKKEGIGKGKENNGEVDGAQMIWETGDKTIEDYYALPDERRVELIDGVFYDMAAPTLVHQIISDEIGGCFRDFIKKNKGKCVSFTAPADVQLFHDDKTMVQPDVFVVCDRDKLIKQRVLDVPDLVVEVVSPGSLKMDTRLKLGKYNQAGVREYWIVFPEEKRVLVYLFAKAKEAVDTVPKEYTFADRVPVGIWDDKCEVDFAEIYEQCSFLYETGKGM